MAASIKKENSIFFNHSFDKKRLKALISWVFKKSGEAEAVRVLDLLKETGFRYATKAGISIGIHDLTTPIQKSWLISESQQAMNTTDRDFIGAKITATERSQRIIDTWHRASESLSKQVVDYFGIYDQFNPVYIMALSGARGNFSQVRQLIGMRGLMADQQGKIVNFPIRSNLREGLTLTEYFISCSGARKGLVDTALRTADTGYLTRRLVDVSHHVVVKRIRCNTNRGIAFKSLQSYNKILLALKERLVGRVLAEDVEMPFSFTEAEQNEQRDVIRRGKEAGSARVNQSTKLIAKKDQEISPKLSLKIASVRNKVFIRSPLTCGFTHSVCQLCYGWSISQGSLVSLGDAVGVIAAQSIGEPGTQLTMRTFHTGGVFSGDLLQEIRAPHAGVIQFSKAFQGLLIRTAHGRIAFLSKMKGNLFLSNNLLDEAGTGHSQILPSEDRDFQKERAPMHACKASEEKARGGTAITDRRSVRANYVKVLTANTIKSKKKKNNFTEIPIQAFTMLFVRQGEKVENNQLLAEFSIQSKEGNQPIKTQQTIFAELSGKVIEDRSGNIYTKPIKESVLLLDPLLTPELLLYEPLNGSYKSSICKGALTPKEYVSTSTYSEGVRNLEQNIAVHTCKSPICKSDVRVRARRASFYPPFTMSALLTPCYKSSICTSKRVSPSCFFIYPCSFTYPRKGLVRAIQGLVQARVHGNTSGEGGEHEVTNRRFVQRKFVRERALTHTCPTSSLYKSSICNPLLAPTLLVALHRCPYPSLYLPLLEASKGANRGYGTSSNLLCKNLQFVTPYKSCCPNRAPSCSYLYGVTNRRFVQAKKVSPKVSLKVSALASTLLRSKCSCSFLLFYLPVLLYLPLKGVSTSNSRVSTSTAITNQRFVRAIQGLVKDQPVRALTFFAPSLRARTCSYNQVHGSYSECPLKSKILKGAKEVRKAKVKQSKKCSLPEGYVRAKKANLKSEDLENDVFKYIEPVKSGRLGFLKIISTRVGATLDYTSPIKSFDYPFVKKKNKQRCALAQKKDCCALTKSTTERGRQLPVRTNFLSVKEHGKDVRLKKSVKYLHPEYIKENRFFLQTIAEYGDVVEEAYKTKII